MKNLKITIVILMLSIFVISCSKSDDAPEKANFLQELLSVAVFTSTNKELGGGFATSDEKGLVFKPKFKGKITAFVLKLPSTDNVKVTLWDFTAKTKITDAIVNITTPEVDFVKEITPVQLEKDKEYVISYNSLYSYDHINTEKIVYPIVTKNFIITDFLFNNGSNQVFPVSSISDFVINGDCSFIYQKTE
jgi:hypothetical protein